MKIKPTLLLDIIENGRFICQIPYYRHGARQVINKKIVEVFNARDIERYIYEKRPSLRGRNINIEFTKQRVY